MFFLLFAAVAGKLLAVIEVAREPTCYPRSVFEFSGEEDLQNRGQLHWTGVKQEETLAAVVRDRYFEVFKDNFRDNSTVFVKNRQSAIDAIKVQLNTVFRKEMFQELKVLDSEDYGLSPEVHCDKLKHLLLKNLEKFKEHELFTQITKNTELGKLLGEVTVEKVYNLGDFILSYEEQMLNLSLGLSDESKNLAKNLYFKYHEWLLYGSKEQGKLGLNEIFKKIEEFLQVSVRKGKYQRFLPFMLDEALFLAALHMLGLNFDPKPAGSALFLEVHRVSNKEKVRFWNISGYVESDLCGLECDLKDLSSHLSTLISSKSTRSLCKVSSNTDSNTLNYFIAGSILLLLILIAKYYKKIESLFSKNKSD